MTVVDSMYDNNRKKCFFKENILVPEAAPAPIHLIQGDIDVVVRFADVVVDL